MGETRGVSTADPVLELERVWFRFGPEPVLEDVSLRVEPGEFVGLIGPNGSGKTTLLRIALGLLQPLQGKVRLFGQDMGGFRDWRRVGYVPQKATAQLGGFPATVREVVLTGRVANRGLGLPFGAADRAAADRALARAGIASLAGRPIGELSGGQQQRALIARALASEPDLLLLDEPTVGVDRAAQEAFYGLLRRLRGETGLAIVLVSHDIGVVTKEVTRLACLNRRLHYHGDPGLCTDEMLSAFYGHPVEVVTHQH